MKELPVNTYIRFDSVFGQPTISILQPTRTTLQNVFGVIALPWCCFWLMSLWPLISAIMTKKHVDFVLIVFFCFWILGGVFAILATYTFFRPTLPENFILAQPVMYYDSGVPPFIVEFGWLTPYQSGMFDKMLKQIFRKRIKVQLDQEELKSLTLWKLEPGNKLTINKAGRLLELAAGVSAPEREWLFETLCVRYKIFSNSQT